MKFVPMFGLQVTHPYYVDGRCPDFQIRPTQATSRLVENHRCLLKWRPHGFGLLTALTDQGDPHVPIQEGAAFDFQLRLRNPDFALFTDLEKIGGANAPLYTNKGLAQADLPQLGLASRRTESSEQFTVQQPTRRDRFTLSGRPLAGIRRTDLRVSGLGRGRRVTRYDAAAKTITVNSQGIGTGRVFTVTYPTMPRMQRGVFADIQVRIDGTVPQLGHTPVEFQIAFEAKQARWMYYVIADRVDGQFTIVDEGTPHLVFPDELRTDLAEQPDLSDDTAVALTEDHPDKRIVRFASGEPVACQQAPRKHLHLYLDGNRVCGPLPNPSLQNCSVTKVTTNEVPQQEEALFQVIKHIDRPFRTTGG